MSTDDIFKKSLSFRAALGINTIPQVFRNVMVYLCCTAAFLPCTLLGVALFYSFFPASASSLFVEASTIYTFALAHEELITAAFFACLSLGVLGAGLNALHTYHYLRGVRRVFKQESADITYEVAEVMVVYPSTIASLILHKESAFLIDRLHLDREYLLTQFGSLALPAEIAPLLFETHVTLGTLWRAVYEANKDLATYMFSQSVKKKSLYATSFWMDRVLEDRKKAKAWWWRENLSKTRGFAKTLSYGMTGYLSHYAREIRLDPKIRDLGDVILHQEERNQLEEALATRDGSNAVIVGPDGSGRYTVTLSLARAIEEGGVYSEIEYKRMFLIDASSFDLVNDKVTLENIIIIMFNEAVVARNIIFVIDDIRKIVELCKQQGVDFWPLINAYIEHGATSIVVLTDETTYSADEYRRVFEKHFETIKMRDLSSDLFLPYLEDKALAEERKTGRFFTFSALEAIAQALPVFFVEDAPLVKANALVETLATNVSSNSIITEEEVQGYLQKTTGVSLGKVGQEEKEGLLHLEEALEKNVIGQKEAVSAVAKTMRRIRSGITDGGKPMGTFLFLGPTGSGKTETAKTLAKVFFGSEEYMSRIDMGEYALSESAQRLLGDKDREGDLARLIHERPHGVLLLDEFEKSAADVKDLFLRILDEGVFTDGQGRIVSLRTQIIIATSNAGSELIRESHLSGEYNEEAFSAGKRKVIDFVLERGIFKPELVNRFDATVMFLPLSESTVHGVARKMLDELGLRIQDRGYGVAWEDDLVDYVVEHSQASEFGGRAIQRVIQDTIEDIISKKIINGELNQGDTIRLSRKDISLE